VPFTAKRLTILRRPSLALQNFIVYHESILWLPQLSLDDSLFIAGSPSQFAIQSHDLIKQDDRLIERTLTHARHGRFRRKKESFFAKWIIRIVLCENFEMCLVFCVLLVPCVLFLYCHLD